MYIMDIHIHVYTVYACGNAYNLHVPLLFVREQVLISKVRGSDIVNRNIKGIKSETVKKIAKDI